VFRHEIIIRQKKFGETLGGAVIISANDDSNKPSQKCHSIYICSGNQLLIAMVLSQELASNNR
jgi:hypothetical protein